MDKKDLTLTLVTPMKKVHENIHVDEVRLPGEKGEVTVYPDHSPLVTTLGIGILAYKESGKADFTKAAISWGYCEVLKGRVKLLAEEVETADKVNLEVEKKEKTECEKALSSNTLQPEEITKVQNRLAFAEAKIKLVEGK